MSSFNWLDTFGRLLLRGQELTKQASSDHASMPDGTGKSKQAALTRQQIQAWDEVSEQLADRLKLEASEDDAKYALNLLAEYFGILTPRADKQRTVWMLVHMHLLINRALRAASKKASKR